MKDYIEERAVSLAGYIIQHKATVRDAANAFNISKSTVHTEGVILKLFIWKWRNGAVYDDFIKFNIFRAYLYKNRKCKNPEIHSLSSFQDFVVSVLLSLYANFKMCANAVLRI